MLYCTTDFKIGDYWGGPGLILTSFLQQAAAEVRVQSEGFSILLVTWRWGKPHAKECKWPLGAGRGAQLTWSSPTAAGSWNLPATRMSRGRSFPPTLQMRTHFCWHLRFILGREPANATLDFCSTRWWASKWGLSVVICYSAKENEWRG